MGQQGTWVIFQARSGMGVLISWVLRSGFLGVFYLCSTCSWRVQTSNDGSTAAKVGCPAGVEPRKAKPESVS